MSRKNKLVLLVAFVLGFGLGIFAMFKSTPGESMFIFLAPLMYGFLLWIITYFLIKRKIKRDSLK